jgi:hypothetical protein
VSKTNDAYGLCHAPLKDRGTLADTELDVATGGAQNPQKYMNFAMRDVIVTSVAPGGSGGRR